MESYVLGCDYGTDSVRTVLIHTADGKELASSVHWYKRWKEGKYCDPASNQFRQHPLDHLEGLEQTIQAVMSESGVTPSAVRGICVDTTGSSPLPVDKEGRALALLPEFTENPNAMMVLWKDHTAIAEADEINEVAASWGGEDFTKYEGGIYSSEWFWAKILHIIREDEAVRAHAYSWIEHCDWITHVLIGSPELSTLKRSRCAAGHKAMWHSDWKGLPPTEFLEKFHPYLAEVRGHLYEDTYTSDVAAGTLSPEWAAKLGLPTDTVIAVGTFDAHAGAVGVGIESNSLVRVMGTSTCDMMVAPPESIGSRAIRGICGQVAGSILPGMVGLEAGQSAFGDVLAWWKKVMMWPIHQFLVSSTHLTEEQKDLVLEEIDQQLIPTLSEEAAKIPLSASIPTALDWVNGRRTPDANPSLKSAISGLSLGTQAPHIFKALVHAICFGSKKIVDRFEEEGVPISKVIGIGGVARKSPYIMQTLSNVLNRPITVATSDYAPALGAAIYAAVAAGIYPSVLEASKKMGSDFEAEYHPQIAEVEALAEMSLDYDALSEFMESLTAQKMEKISS